MGVQINIGAPDSGQRTVNYLSQTLLEMAGSAAIGYYMSHIFKLVNPVHGAVFCAVSVPVSRIVDHVMDNIFNRAGASTESKIVGKVISYAISTAISAGVATLIGFPITFHASLMMGVAIFAGYCLITITLAALQTLVKC